MKKNNTVANAAEPDSRTEKTLPQSEQRMRLHIEQTPLAVIEWDTDFRVLQWNPSAEKIFGFTASEAIGQHVAFILPDSAKANVDRAWRDLLAQQGGRRITNDNVTKDGRLICCEWYSTHLTNASGQIIGVASLAQDITERKRASEELRESKQLLSEIQNLAHTCGWKYDFKTNTITWTDGLYRLLGYEPGSFEPSFERYWQHIHPDDRDLVRSVHESMEEVAGDIEYRIVAADGSVRYILTRNRFEYDGEDIPVCLYGAIANITERKLASEELQENKNFLSEIQQLVRIGGFKYDFRTGCSFWSDELYRLLGYDPGTVTPSFGLYFQHIHPDDQPMIAALSTNVGSIPPDVECRLVSNDGVLYYTIHRTRYDYDNAGNPLYLYGSVVDITSRKLVEIALKTSRDNLEKIFQTSPDAIIFSDAVGNIVAANDAVENALGYSPQELIGQSYVLLAPDEPEDMLELRKVMGDLFETGFVKAHEAIFRKKNGDNIYLECNARALRDDSGEITGAVSVMRDISLRKEMEAQLRQSQKMEAIGTLAGGIAHDFNNILAAIMGYTELSLDELSRGLSVEHNLDQILKSTMRARDLVRQILAFSRRDMEQQAPLQISSIVKEAAKLLRATLPSTIDIQENISDQPGMVKANPTQIHQIVMNLCTNAAHAMSENGGVLGIRVEPFFSDTRHMPLHHGPGCGAYVKITVSDTGVGIDPRNIDRIFEPFFTTKGIGKGTGMGLAVAHGIVKSHGGEILVRSEPGKGSTFEVLLPQLPDGGLSGGSETSRPARGTERILFVDDEEMLLDLGRSMLKSLGYTPTVTHSSPDALKLFKKNPFGFDLVITDMTMPQMTGYILAGELIRIRPGIPVIIATGYSEKISEETARELGVRALVMKPLNRLELAQAIRTALDSKAA